MDHTLAALLGSFTCLALVLAIMLGLRRPHE